MDRETDIAITRDEPPVRRLQAFLGQAGQRRERSGPFVAGMIAAALFAGAAWLTSAVVESATSEASFVSALRGAAAGDIWMRVVLMVFGVAVGLALVYALDHSRRLRDRLRAERSRIEQVYASSHDAAFEIGADMTIRCCSSSAARLLGRSQEGLLGATCYSAVFHRDAPCEECPLVMGIAEPLSVERSVYDPVAVQRRWLWQSFHPVLDEQGKRVSVIETLRDITLARESQQALAESHVELQGVVAALSVANEELSCEVERHEQTASALVESEIRYRQLVESSPDMVFVHKKGRIVFVNSAGAALMGLTEPAEAIGLWVADFVASHDGEVGRGQVGALLDEHVPGAATALKLRRRDGQELDVEITSGEMFYEGEQAVQCVVRDVTEIMAAREAITRLAFHDALTGLPNGTLFRDRLAAMLARARRRSETVAVLFVDVDNLQPADDVLDDGVQRAALMEIARRFSQILREEDTLARHGNEFGIVAHATDRTAIKALADRLMASMAQEIDLGAHMARARACIGVAVYPDDGLSVSALMRNADLALHDARSRGAGTCCFYSPEMRESLSTRLRTESDLRLALDRDEFELHFQPQMDTEQSCCLGFEALLRWRHPTRGLLLPGEFLGSASAAGLLGPIDEWVVRSACRTASRWLAEGVDIGRVAVNISAKSLLVGGISDCVRRALRESGLAPECLELEIVETAAVEDTIGVLSRLGELSALGVRIAIDDFGTGYSSLSYLRRIPVHTLKIAREFIREIGVSSQSEVIAASLTEMCRGLGVDVVAEGVETQAQADFLRMHGCKVVQGYLVSRPMPAEEVRGFLESRSRCAS